MNLTLNMPEMSIQVSVIKVSDSFPSKLDASRILHRGDFPALSELVSFYKANSLQGLIDVCEGALTVLSEKLEEEGSMLELTDPLHLDYIYILAHKSDHDLFAPYLKNHTFGIFRFNLKELFRNDMDKLIQYLNEIKSVNYLLFNKYTESQHLGRKYREISLSTIEDIRHSEKLIGERRNELIQLRLTEKEIEQEINNQKQRISEAHPETLECLFCRISVKNVVMIPCGHAIACQECMEQLEIPIGRKLRHRFPCPLCKNAVKETREIIY